MGRHFSNFDKTTKDFVIVYYRFSPWNEEMFKRIVNLRNNLEPEDEKQNLGYEHFLDPIEHVQWMKEWQSNARDLTKEIKHFTELMEK